MRCVHPVTLARKDCYGHPQGVLEVPCGKCAVCCKERSKAWALRLMMEKLYWNDAIYITLTYEDEYLPLVKPTLTSDGHLTLPYSLCKRDLQLFFKRLRKAISPLKIKYYAVGEYGGQTFRPHYHAIVFGLSYSFEPVIAEAWKQGFVKVEEVNIRTCNYVAGYVQKKLYGNYGKDVYGNREFPFSLMSKGLGKKYVIDHCDEMLCDGFIRFDGITLSIPRYYWKMMDKEGLVDYWDIKSRKNELSRASRHAEDYKYAKRGLFGNDRLREKEKTLRAVEDVLRQRELYSNSRSGI